MKACVPRRNSVDVEVPKRDVDARFVGTVEEIVALNVAWVETGEVGRRERAVHRRIVVERERAVLFFNHQTYTTAPSCCNNKKLSYR